MSMGALVDTPPRKPSMPEPSKRRPAETAKQLGIRVSDGLLVRLESTASGLGLDVSSLIRMVLMENLPRYERRVAQIHDEESAGCSDQDAESP
jgi:hypothetical protein